MKIIGTGGGDTLRGGIDNDIIKGLDGDDWLEGQGGNDRLLGGDGRDHISGGDGGDRLQGDGGDDWLDYGQSGNDTVLGGSGADLLIGGNAISNRSILLDGGDGDDLIYLNDQSRLASFTVSGGDGADDIECQYAKAGVIDAGAGDDYVYAQIGSLQIALGEGHDQLELNQNATAHILDFTAEGQSADSLILSNFLIGKLPGWDQASNPFNGGFVRFDQRGADAVLQIDADGGGDGWTDAIVFDGLDASALTARQLSGYAQHGARIEDFHLKGTAAADHLFGGAGDDVLTGAGGDDTLSGELGRDTLIGGAGDDALSDDSGGDTDLRGGGGDDALLVFRTIFETSAETILLDGGAGRDQISYFGFGGEVSSVTALGGEGDDNINLIHAAAVTIEGGAGADIIYAANNVAATFVYADLSDSTVAEADELAGFQKGYVIDLSRIDADTTLSGDQAFVLVDHLSGQAGELAVRFDKAQDVTIVEADVDGDGGADLRIEIDGSFKGFHDFVL